MEERTVFFADESPEMRAAYKKARDTFKYFWREIWWERRRIIPGLGVACVKAKFAQERPDGEPIVEHMWFANIDFDGFTVKGTLINQPNELTNIKDGDDVEMPLNEITDWLFAIGNKPFGGFTIQTLRAGMGEEERKAHDEAWGMEWGLAFGDLDKIQVAHGQDEFPERLTEHPMSVNMAESLRDFLAKHPNELTHKDALGYTMLHRETIAGNKTIVEILLEMGADANAKTNSGHTAADFVGIMGWEHLKPVLLI